MQLLAAFPDPQYGLMPRWARDIGQAHAADELREAGVKLKSTMAAGRILCRRLKYATGHCKWQSGLAATIH